MAKTQTKNTDKNAPQGNPEKAEETGKVEVESIEEEAPNIFGGGVSDDSFDFEKAEGVELFGGSYPRLELKPDSVSVPLTYRKDTEIPLPDQDSEGKETTKMQTVHVVEVPQGDLVTCPISAIFMKHFKEAKIEKGDTFRIKRYPNAVKKRGRGAGNQMQVYAIAVTARASTVDKAEEGSE